VGRGGELQKCRSIERGKGEGREKENKIEELFRE